MNIIAGVKKWWLLLATILSLFLGSCLAETYHSESQSPERLRLYSSTDEQVMQPLLIDFQLLYPNVTIEYAELNSVPLFEKFLDEYQQGATADVLISSAMDLQIKLVNDGYAATHEIKAYLSWLPDWAQWRKQAFGFTYEPAVMIYNTQLLKEGEVPQSRFELIDLLRKQTHRFTGKVGTYDITRSGLGYLFGSQDAQQASTWGRLTENLSQVKVKLFENSNSMMEAVRSGELLLAYNVLGSYAYTAAEKNAELALILPKDYTLVMSRIAFVSKRAANPEMGHRFLDYLLSERGQSLLATKARLYPIHPNISGAATYSGLQEASKDRGPLKLIKLGPALLTYQDYLKKKNFFSEWQEAIR